MCGRAAKIQLTERQYNLLEQVRCSTAAAQRLVQRARIILLRVALPMTEGEARLSSETALE